jgi:(E)-4-hydroxy-3-methylbut-2-enyl-diphosphate synthase
MRTNIIKKHNTKVIHIGNVAIGGKNPISIQSMTKTDTRDVRATVRQIKQLEEIGCEIIRVAVPDMDAADAIPKIIRQIRIPLIADIHFNWRLAVKSIENGANGVRINPGNIGGREGLSEVIKSAKDKNIPVRIGVNSGSLDKKWIKKYNGVTAEALVGSALEYIKIIEGMGFSNLKISIKAADIFKTLACYRLIAKKTKYPLHVGLTEAGPLLESAVRSSIAIGTLLMEGIGDTIRISVTGDPCNEVLIAKEILQSLRLRPFGPEIISCPTCGRCKVNLVEIVRQFQQRLFAEDLKLSTRQVKVAIMGCVVNGPGEAKDADIGVACGTGKAVLFKKGKMIRNINEKEITNILIRELKDF